MEDPTEKGPNYEQKKWEEEHLNAALLKFGAKDAKSKKKEKDYEYVLDEEIDFVQALTMPGSKKDKEVSSNTRGGTVLHPLSLGGYRTLHMHPLPLLAP
jgi:hypothetical protein